MTEVSENEILQCFLKSIEESIPINFDEWKIEWGNYVEGMPVFTVREIEDHNKESGRNGATIEKTSERSLQFKNEHYLNADTILWKQRISLNSKVSATLVWRRKNALLWLVTVPSGLISDKNIAEQFGIVLTSLLERNEFRPVSFTIRFLILCGEVKHWFDLFEAKTFWRLRWRNTNVYGFIRSFLRRLCLLHFQ